MLNFFPFYMLLLCLNDDALCPADTFSFIKSHWLIVDLSVYVSVFYFRKLSSVPLSSSLFSTFFCVRFSVQVLCLGLWPIWSWILFRMISMDLFRIFYAAFQFGYYPLLKMLSYFFKIHCLKQILKEMMSTIFKNV